MDNLREKLIDLVSYQADFLPWDIIENIADHLIANGVTVQKTNSQMQEEARAREAVIVDLRKKWQAAEALICTMCGHCEYEEAGGILRMQTDCGEICGYPCCGKFTSRDRWIPVTERLPDFNNNVLVVCKYPFDESETITLACREYGNEHFWDIVTHWMPLPEPPKEEGA